MRIAILALITIINLILQSTLSLYLDSVYMLPNSMIVLVISYAIVRNDVEGAIFGFANGILFDIMFGRIIGMYALVALTTGFIAAKPFKEFSPNNFVISSAMIFAMTIFYELMFYVLAFLFQGRTDILFYLRRIILPEAILNVIISIVIYPAIFYLNKRLEEHEKPKRKMFGSIGGNSGKI